MLIYIYIHICEGVSARSQNGVRQEANICFLLMFIYLIKKASHYLERRKASVEFGEKPAWILARSQYEVQ